MVRFLYENSIDDIQDAINAISFCCADISDMLSKTESAEINEQEQFTAFLNAVILAFKNRDKIFVFEGEHTGLVTFVKIPNIANLGEMYIPALWAIPILEDHESYKFVYEELLDVASRNLDHPFCIFHKEDDNDVDILLSEAYLREIAEEKGIIECGFARDRYGRKLSVFLNSSFGKE